MSEKKHVFPMLVMTHMFFPQISEMFLLGMPLISSKALLHAVFLHAPRFCKWLTHLWPVTKTFQGATSECFRSGNNDETTKNILDLSL